MDHAIVKSEMSLEDYFLFLLVLWAFGTVYRTQQFKRLRARIARLEREVEELKHQ